MKYFKVFICYFLCVLLTVPVCFAETPSDISVKNVNLNINGSIAGIANPTSTEDGETWKGSKIYYGHNNYYKGTSGGETAIILKEIRLPELSGPDSCISLNNSPNTYLYSRYSDCPNAVGNVNRDSILLNIHYSTGEGDFCCVTQFPNAYFIIDSDTLQFLSKWETPTWGNLPYYENDLDAISDVFPIETDLSFYKLDTNTNTYKPVSGSTQYNVQFNSYDEILDTIPNVNTVNIIGNTNTYNIFGNVLYFSSQEKYDNFIALYRKMLTHSCSLEDIPAIEQNQDIFRINLEPAFDSVSPTDLADGYGLDTITQVEKPVLWRVLDTDSSSDFNTQNTSLLVTKNSEVPFTNYFWGKFAGATYFADLDSLYNKIELSKAENYLFSPLELSYIQPSSKEGTTFEVNAKVYTEFTGGDSNKYQEDDKFTGISENLDNQKLFSLSKEEVTNEKYGFRNNLQAAFTQNPEYAHLGRTFRYMGSTLRSRLQDYVFDNGSIEFCHLYELNALIPLAPLENSNTYQYVIDNNIDAVPSTSYYGGLEAVNPAMNLSNNAIAFTVARDTKKSGFDSVNDSNAETNIWKSTLYDSNNNFDALRIDNGDLSSGTTVKISVQNIGDSSDYSQISGILTDDNGTVLCYGHANEAFNEEGEYTFTIPEDVDSGTNFYVFAEKAGQDEEGYYYSDYCSNMVNISLQMPDDTTDDNDVNNTDTKGDAEVDTTDKGTTDKGTTGNEETIKQTVHEEVCVNNQTDEQNVQEKTSPETGDAAKPLVLISAIIMLAIIFFLNFDKKDKK